MVGNGRDSQLKPLARSFENYEFAEFGSDETVLLDSDRLQYHTLNRTAWVVWQLCDGKRVVSEIEEMLVRSGEFVPTAVVELAIAELNQAGLLEAELETIDRRIGRRRVMKLVASGLLGGALVPTVSSISAPVSANHTSCGATGGEIACGVGNQCVCSAECACGCCCIAPSGQFCADRDACQVSTSCLSF